MVEIGVLDKLASKFEQVALMHDHSGWHVKVYKADKWEAVTNIESTYLAAIIAALQEVGVCTETNAISASTE